VREDGTQQVLEELPEHEIPVEDLSSAEPGRVEARLAELREQLSHAVLPSDQWPLWVVRYTRLPGGTIRLHLGFDLLAADLHSLRIILDEWLHIYQEPALLLPPLETSMDPSAADLDQVPKDVDIDGVYVMPVNNPTGRTMPPDRMRAFIDAALARWPHAGIILDSVYVRLHPSYSELLTWFTKDERYHDSVMFIDSLSKTHGVTGLRSGVLLTGSGHLAGGVIRYAQNIAAGPSNAMQAVALALLAPFMTGDPELIQQRMRLGTRIGRHLQRRRRLLLEQAFKRHGELLDASQPVLPDPETFDWPGSMYADVRLSDRCLEIAHERSCSPTVAFYLETGIGGVPLDGFCRNPNLERHGLVINADSPALNAFQKETSRFVRLSFGMTPPPAAPQKS